MKIINILKIGVTALIMNVGLANASPILWVGDVGSNLGTVDAATGNVNVIGNMGTFMTDIAFDPLGNLYGVSFDNLYSIDKNTASASLIGNFGSASLNSLTFDAAGNLYAANTSLYSINVATGMASIIGNGGDAYSSSGDLAFIGGELFLSSNGTPDNLFKLDTGTGFGTLVGNIGFNAVFGLATNNNVDLFGVGGTSVLSINEATGAGAFLVDYSGQGLFAAGGSAFFAEAGATPRAVPEPSTLAIFALGMMGLASRRFKKQY
ncbi:PEP-CTERM sorting domain-containing protein [Colwellia sp. MB02u-6]|uniref:PEP-CTERM sorting domain-containing protein n=1 Tax=Colwellia sp. MB02u-6 TaxID=2759824 RepID=UPI0015F460F0|nr:PEP-CTERM sorting domain-containing protein [Colwellia sp. MB02u-6]MBA6326559.1 PEP-CTERM sorting domain-containing protein [Colwellia sp. MB02u-6]